MAYRDLLLLLDERGGDEAAMAAAVDLAARHDAHLTALFPAIETPLPSFVAAQMTRSIRDQQRRQLGDRAGSGRERFETACKRNGVSCEWRQVTVLSTDAFETLTRHARYADLVIVGQPPLEHGDSDRIDLLQDLILGCGRPVLAVPVIGAPAGFGGKAMVAWDSGREAARAVADALPLLQQARSVEVVTVNARRRRTHGEEPGADIARHLARHGVKVEVAQLESGSLAVGDLLLNRAADNGLDLLVMGAYAHSRLRDFVLGGVTRHMLDHMTLPVFLAH